MSPQQQISRWQATTSMSHIQIKTSKLLDNIVCNLIIIIIIIALIQNKLKNLYTKQIIVVITLRQIRCFFMMLIASDAGISLIRFLFFVLNFCYSSLRSNNHIKCALSKMYRFYLNEWNLLYYICGVFPLILYPRPRN